MVNEIPGKNDNKEKEVSNIDVKRVLVVDDNDQNRLILKVLWKQ
jgi:hypothetical protein